MSDKIICGDCGDEVDSEEIFCCYSCGQETCIRCIENDMCFICNEEQQALEEGEEENES